MQACILCIPVITNYSVHISLLEYLLRHIFKALTITNPRNKMIVTYENNRLIAILCSFTEINKNFKVTGLNKMWQIANMWLKRL
jgi:hypothetical protein